MAKKDLEDGFERVALDLSPHTHVLILLEDTGPKIKEGLAVYAADDVENRLDP